MDISSKDFEALLKNEFQKTGRRTDGVPAFFFVISFYRVLSTMTADAVDFNEVRDGSEGMFIGIQEAKEIAVGNEEWWKLKGIGGKTVELKQHDPSRPIDKPIFAYKDGSMYLGGWKADGLKGYHIRHGFGISYCNGEDYKGQVFVANWKDGKLHGQGKSFWLESSPSWITNERRYSPIQEKVDGYLIGRPHVYEGHFVCGKRYDPIGKVTLKDGTCRVGPWEARRPMGSWWSDNDHPQLSAEKNPRESLQDDDDTEEIRPAKQARHEPPEDTTKSSAAQDAMHALADNKDKTDDGNSTVAVHPPFRVAYIHIHKQRGSVSLAAAFTYLG